MRYLLIISFSLIFFVSCKTAKIASLPENETDTLQFTYMYSEALKYKMLGNNNTAKQIFKRCLRISKESTAAAYELSDLYFSEQKYDSAKVYSDFCLKYKPDNEWFLIQRAKVAQKLNDVQRYNAIYKKLAQLFPENLTYTFEEAVILYDEKNYDAALRTLDNIEQTVGVNEDVSFLKNNIFYEQKRFDAIQAELLKLKVFFPDSVKYMDMLADFYLNTNQPDKAYSLYLSILALDKQNVLANYGLATLYAKSKNFTQGFPYLQYILENTSLREDRKEKVADLYLEAPDKSLTNEQTIFIYKNLIHDKDVDIDILNDYLAFLFKLKDLTETEKVAKYSIKEKPENYWGWDYLFNIYLAQSRIDELNTYALKALEYYPNHAQIYFYVGYSCFYIKKFNDAINYFESGLNYVADNKALELQFYLYLAECYHSVGKHKKSDEFFDLYLKSDSTNAYLMNNYAFYLVSRNIELEKASRLSMKSIEIEPFNSSFLDTYSWILFKRSKFTEALNYIERSYRYGGNKNAIIIEHYGDILLGSGKAKDAVEKWEEAYSLNKNNSNILQKINQYKSGE